MLVQLSPYKTRHDIRLPQLQENVIYLSVPVKVKSGLLAGCSAWSMRVPDQLLQLQIAFGYWQGPQQAHQWQLSARRCAGTRRRQLNAVLLSFSLRSLRNSAYQLET